MISNRNIINLILEIKKTSFAALSLSNRSLFLIERFYNVKKTKKTVKKPNQQKPLKNRPTLICIYYSIII